MFNITQDNYQAPQGFNVPQGWSAVNNNSNNVYRGYLGFDRKRDTPFQTGSWWAGQGQISPEDLASNATYNQGQDSAFAAKYPGQQMIRRQLGDNLMEYGLLDQSGNISNNWQFKNDDSLDWMENTVPALSMLSLAAMGAQGLGGFDPSSMVSAAAPEAASGGLNALATNPALIESAAGTAGYGASSAGAGGWNGLSSLFSGITNNPIANQVGKKMTGNIVGNLINGVLGTGGQGSGGISTIGNLGSLFTNYNQYKQTGDLMNQIKDIYSPDSPYAKYMQEQLGRKDAAAGRNSQYGPRLAQLMGILGEGQARSLSGLFNPIMQQQGGLNGMVGAGSRLLTGSGLGDWITQQLGGSQGGMLAGELGQTPSTWDRVGDNVDWESLFGG